MGRECRYNLHKKSVLKCFVYECILASKIKPLPLTKGGAGGGNVDTISTKSVWGRLVASIFVSKIKPLPLSKGGAGGGNVDTISTKSVCGRFVASIFASKIKPRPLSKGGGMGEGMSIQSPQKRASFETLFFVEAAGVERRRRSGNTFENKYFFIPATPHNYVSTPVVQ